MYHKKTFVGKHVDIKLIMIVLLFTAIFLMNIVHVNAVDSWYDSDWSYRKSITVPTSNIISDLYNFPMLLDIIDTDLANKAQIDGDDIVFTDSFANKLSHEIELWDNNTGHLIAWIKVPFLSSSADTTLYMYYGNAIVSSQEDQSSVWSSNYTMVLHLAETSGIHIDSTLNGNDGTVAGGVDQNLIGVVDGAVELLGVNGYIGVAHSDDITGFDDSFTASCWVRIDDSTKAQYIMNKYDPNNESRAWYISYREYDTSIAFVASENGINPNTWWTDFTPVPNEWNYLTVVWESNTIPRIYLNGTLMPVSGTSTISSIYNNNLTSLSLGRYYQFYNLDGGLDEIRIAKTSQSSEWITTEYLNQHDPSAFYTLGAEFTGQEFYITSTAGTGGTINPEGLIPVIEGNNKTYYIKNDEGCAVLDVIVDSISMGPRYSYTFYDISDNHTIEAQFVSVPPPTITLDKSSYDRGQVVKITINGGTEEKPVMLQVKNPSGTIVWVDQDNFGATGAYIHEFLIPSSWAYGVYTVHVKDSDAGTVRSTSMLIQAPYVPPYIPPYIPPVNKNPISVAGPNQTSFVNRAIFFNGSQSYDPDGTVDTYLWIFGDGDTSTNKIVSHSYSEAGQYLVKLIVIDLMGNTGSSNLTVNVKDLPITPTVGLDIGIGANQTNFIIDALDDMGILLKLNTSDQVTVSIFKYPGNPYPNTTLPLNGIPSIIDILVSSSGSINWPIYVERHYTNSEIDGLIEDKLGLYYYDNGGWYLCRETGVYTDVNIVWANMYEDELYGSPTIVAERPTPATFILSQLSITPTIVMPGEPVNVTLHVLNIGEETGDYNVSLIVNDEVELTNMINLNASETQLVSFSLIKMDDGEYTVMVGNLTGVFNVYTPTPAEFILSGFDLTSTMVIPGENVQGTIQITNIGETSGVYNLDVFMDLVSIYSEDVILSGGGSSIVTFVVSSEVEGIHNVTIEDETLSFSVAKPAEFTLSEYMLNSSQVEPGIPILGSIKVTNIGGASGVYNLDVFMDLVSIYSEDVILSGGGSSIVTFVVSSEVEGIHNVTIEDETLSFSVSYNFESSDLILEKNEVEVGDILYGSIKISNNGIVTGNYELVVYLNDAIIFTSTTEIPAGEDKIVNFEILTEEAGSNIIYVEEHEISFTVLEKSQDMTLYVYLVILVVLIGIIYYAWNKGLLKNLI